MLVSINAASKLLGLGRTSVNRLLREKKIDFVKVGRRPLIPATSLVEFVACGGDRRN